MATRGLILAGVGYVFATVYIVQAEAPKARSTPERSSAPGEVWFARVKPRCNPVEVAVALADDPPPATPDGAGYAASCWALAGKIPQARMTIEALRFDHRAYAASVVFYIAHPVADRGDDVSAGPMMELVLEFKPDDFQALYHAGMSEYALGKPDEARIKLTQFRRLYTATDFFGTNADATLDRIAKNLPPATASPGAHD